jgi:hypothetical protein
MHRVVIAFTLLFLNIGGVLFAQKGAADPAQRYFRLICLVHLTGSGKQGDPILPEYVAQGTAVAVAAAAATQSATMSSPANPGAPSAASRPTEAATTAQPTGTGPAPMASRPGYLGWSMQTSDDGKMAIIQIVAADHHAFDSILADTRPEIRVFEIGKTPPATIQAEMQKYKANFDLTNFRVIVP